MFEINLLAKPGLQGIEAAAEGLEVTGRERTIIERLAARHPEAKPPAAEVSLVKKKSKGWFWVVIFLVIILVALWWYKGWDWKPWSMVFPPEEGVPVTGEAVLEKSPAVTCLTVLRSFLDQLPPAAAIDFMSADGGILMYRIWGQQLRESLRELNQGVAGHRFSDLIAPVSDPTPGYWLGSVAFTSRSQVGALRPVQSEYDRFFRLLQTRVDATGGVVVAMIPGMMTTGEYVLKGSLGEIQAHLTTAAEDSINIHYHRISLLKPDVEDAIQYLLRVTFNLVEERNPSPLSLSPVNTGA